MPRSARETKPIVLFAVSPKNRNGHGDQSRSNSSPRSMSSHTTISAKPSKSRANARASSMRAACLVGQTKRKRALDASFARKRRKCGTSARIGGQEIEPAMTTTGNPPPHFAAASSTVMRIPSIVVMREAGAASPGRRLPALARLKRTYNGTSFKSGYRVVKNHLEKGTFRKK
ncbi:hypothetical protein NFJ02_24g56530 [Pycnococcus provasolii]